MDVEPRLPIGLVLADPTPDLLVENLRPATGHAAQPRVDQLLEHPLDRFLADVSKPIDLDTGPRLDVNPRVGVVNHPDHVDVPLKRLLVVQPADDVDLGRPRLGRLRNPLADHFLVKRVGSFGLQIRSERTEHAAGDADVGWGEMDIRVVEGQVAVLAFADRVGQLAQEQQVGELVQVQPVLEGNPLAGFDRLGNRPQARIAMRTAARFAPGVGSRQVHQRLAPVASVSTRVNRILDAPFTISQLRGRQQTRPSRPTRPSHPAVSPARSSAVTGPAAALPPPEAQASQ